MPEKPKVEQWMRESAEKIWQELAKSASEMADYRAEDYNDECINVALIAKQSHEVIIQIIASHAPTPAPEPTPNCQKCNAVMQTLPATIFCPICDKASAPAAAQGAPDGTVSTPGGAEGGGTSPGGDRWQVSARVKWRNRC